MSLIQIGTALDQLLGSVRKAELPVNPQLVARRLGLRVVFADSGEAPSAALPDKCSEATLSYDDRVITLHRSTSRSNSSLTPRERFSIAHEIGHWLIHNWPHTMPRLIAGEEDLADFVAGSLLIPTPPLAQALDNTTNHNFARTTSALASRARVSPQVAAIRVCDAAPQVGLVFFKGSTVAWRSGWAFDLSIPRLVAIKSELDSASAEDGGTAWGRVHGQMMSLVNKSAATTPRNVEAGVLLVGIL